MRYKYFTLQVNYAVEMLKQLILYAMLTPINKCITILNVCFWKEREI